MGGITSCHFPVFSQQLPQEADQSTSRVKILAVAPQIYFSASVFLLVSADTHYFLYLYHYSVSFSTATASLYNPCKPLYN